MSRAPMKARSIRVSDKAWTAALEAADRKGETLSEEIRAFIEAYGKTDTPQDETCARSEKQS